MLELGETKKGIKYKAQILLFRYNTWRNVIDKICIIKDFERFSAIQLHTVYLLTTLRCQFTINEAAS